MSHIKLDRILIGLLSLSMVACASTAPEPIATTENTGNVTSENAVALEEANIENVDTSELPQTAAVDAAVDENYDPDEKICRRERQTGSNFSIRICQTRAEIEARAKQDQDIMNVYQRKRACAAVNECQ